MKKKMKFLFIYKKNAIVKSIESNKPSEGCQADTVIFSNYVRDEFKHFFTKWIKYGLIIP